MENIKLWENGTPMYDASFGQPEPDLTPFLLPEKRDESGNLLKRGCVIVCPGGGYTHRAVHEGGPVAEMLNGADINAFVLNYRFEPYKSPAIIKDVQRAVRLVRYNAEKFGIDPEKVAVLGFSAGGHLASMASTLYDDGIEGGDEIDRVYSRPDAALFCYAVLTMNLDYGDAITRGVFIGGLENEDALERAYSPYLNVRDDCPPVFMWHTSADPIVPVENSLNMASALSEKKIPFELHVFPEGAHGLGLAKDTKGTCAWPSLAQNWLKRLGY